MDDMKFLDTLEEVLLERGFPLDIVQSVLETVRIFPAADVAPVKHGRWLTWEEMFPGKTPKRKNNLGVFCDQCRKHADNMSDYCPNCGAKMDLECPDEA